MKNKFAFGIILLFTFGCKNNTSPQPDIIYLPYNSNVSWFKEFFLKNISELSITNEDSISLHQCKNTFGKNLLITLNKNEIIHNRDRHGGITFTLDEINFDNKNIGFTYSEYRSYRFLYEKNDSLKFKVERYIGDFKISKSEIKECGFFKKKKIKVK